MKKIIIIVAICLLLVGCSLFREHVLQGTYKASSKDANPYAWEFFGDGVKIYDSHGNVLRQGTFKQTEESVFTVWWNGYGKTAYTIEWQDGWKEAFYFSKDVYTLV